MMIVIWSAVSVCNLLTMEIVDLLSVMPVNQHFTSTVQIFTEFTEFPDASMPPKMMLA